MAGQVGFRVVGPIVNPSCALPGSPFRDEITLAILQLQENNRLEILKRKWWEGGRCPKEEDHRAKGQPSPSRTCSFPETPWAHTHTLAVSTLRFGHGEHWWYFCRADLWPHHCCLRGGHGIHLVHAEVSGVRGGEEIDQGLGRRRGDP